MVVVSSKGGQVPTPHPSVPVPLSIETWPGLGETRRVSSHLTRAVDATVTPRDRRGSMARVASVASSLQPMWRVCPRLTLTLVARHLPAMHRTPGTLAPTHLAARARLTPVGARVHTGHANVSEVSDSEPEREGRRKTEKQSRKRQKKHHLPLQCQADVIELTDSQEPILTQPTSQPSQVPPTTQSVISIHGSVAPAA